MTVSGWGSAPWGLGPWGAGAVDALELLGALAVRENVVRLSFNVAPHYTGLLTQNDAANPARYVLTPQGAPEAISGGPARPVLPVQVQVAAVAGSGGRLLDVVLDRPLSPWATRYAITVNLLRSYDGAMLDPSKASAVFDGLYRQLRPADASAPTPSRDVANPWGYQAQLSAGVVPSMGDLGVFPVDASGDYAFDQGIQQLKKRIFRRLNTPKNAFPSLPGYGVGVPTYSKRLGTEAIRQQIVADAQAQLSSEPDVAAVSVKAFTPAGNPSVTIFRVQVRMAGSAGDTTFDFPYTNG